MITRSACLLAAALAAGCDQGDPTARFVPAEDVARNALVTGLNAWKKGIPKGEVPGTSPLVYVVDSYREPGETLKAFQVLGEVPADAPRCYAVELQFDPPRSEKARFVVVGIDPLWVFRMEDYQLLAQWDHHMKDETPNRPAVAPKPAGSDEPR